jgi:fructokinase
MIVVGEALVDLVTEADGRLDPRPGGAARNLAIAAARLGAEVTFAAGLSTDPFGRRLRTALAEEGIDLSCAPVVDDPTPLAVVHLGSDGGAQYSFHLAGTAATALHTDDLACLRGDEPVHVSLGAINLGTPQVGDALVTMLASHGALTSLDPNVRPASLAGGRRDAERIDAAVSLVDVVRCSEEDIALLRPGADPDEVAAGWLDDGPALVVVTRGDDGATALTRAGRVDVGAPAAEVVDTVGAGDTFGAALLVGLHDLGVVQRAGLDRLAADDLRELLEFAAAAAAVTVTRRGADPPRRDEL